MDSDYNIGLEGIRSNQYWDYASITSDLKIVGGFISLLLDAVSISAQGGRERDRISQLIERSLFVSSIITYARCFTPADGNVIKLESKVCFNQAGFKRLHDRVMEIRNQYLAYPGISNNESIHANVSLTHHKQNVAQSLGYEATGQYSISRADLVEFLEMVKYLLDWTIRKRDEEAKKYMKSLTPEERQDLLRKACSKQAHKSA